MNVIGLDIGTTTICAVVTDSDTGKVIKSVTVGNDTFIESAYGYERIQSPMLILNKCTALVETLTEKYSPVAAIGITGQMHGIVYLDKNGCEISPLYIWQDESGNQPYKDGKSFAQYLSDLTGFKMASGFGCTTLFVHTVCGLVPQNAAGLCTIHDYVAMRLAGGTVPVVHTSDAASFGLFNLEKLCFDEEAIEKAGLNFALFPKVTASFDVVGNYGDIPVACAIGDNQASFLGSVSDTQHSLLINLGTGGQISFLTDKCADTGLEIRPCYGSNYLCVGSSLCGGRAFALLEKFLRSTAEFVTGETVKNAYPAIDAFLAKNPQVTNSLEISTRFAGTRNCPFERGRIANIGLDNFTPQHFILGVLAGMTNELVGMYSSCEHGEGHTAIIGSGNGLRKNTALQKLISKSFGMPMSIPAHREEAAFGAALFGMTAAGIKDSISQAQQLIKYKEI